MSKHWWLLGLVGLVLVGLLAGCGSTYSSSSDGLVLVGSQGSNVIQTFSFDLNSGHVATISGPPATNGVPFAMVMDPAGQYAYVIIDQSSIAVFQVHSGGTLSQVGNPIPFNQPTITISGVAPPNNTESVSVMPSMIARDAAGKFLFVANRATADAAQLHVPGSVSVFAIGSGGSLTEVPGSPFFTTPPFTSVSQSTNDIVSVAATATVFPGIGINGTQNSVCSVPGNQPPTSEYLYAVDTLGNQVFEFQVDTSSGTLTAPGSQSGVVPSFRTDSRPVGIAVDPCDRFVYVTDNLTNKISAYSICMVVQLPSPCPNADGSLAQLPDSPFPVSGSANGVGPLVVDPYGNNVYVVGTFSNTISAFKISAVSGSLAPLSPATVATGLGPVSIAIRADDNWLFVANHGSGIVGGATVSQYSITPATGALSVLPTILTDNYPWGVAVK